MAGAPRRTSSASSKLSWAGSEDGPGSIRGGAGVAAGVDGEAAVVAGRPAAGEHLLGLFREAPHLLRRHPESSRGGVLALLLDLAGDDDELPLALVVAKPELPDRPIRLTDGRGGLAGLRGQLGIGQLLRLEQLA